MATPANTPTVERRGAVVYAADARRPESGSPALQSARGRGSSPREAPIPHFRARCSLGVGLRRRHLDSTGEAMANMLATFAQFARRLLRESPSPLWRAGPDSGVRGSVRARLSSETDRTSPATERRRGDGCLPPVRPLSPSLAHLPDTEALRVLRPPFVQARTPARLVRLGTDLGEDEARALRVSRTSSEHGRFFGCCGARSARSATTIATHCSTRWPACATPFTPLSFPEPTTCSRRPPSYGTRIGQASCCTRGRSAARTASSPKSSAKETRSTSPPPGTCHASSRCSTGSASTASSATTRTPP
jgi:hypothetical protein